jgi:crossover junction endodeoxyribonuclease RusA
MNVFELTLPIAAHTKQRPRFGRGRAYTPAGTRNWEELLAWRFIERHGGPKLSCPVRVELFFGGVQSNQDIDNLAKSCLDALNGIAFEDDRQVVELVARKASNRTAQTVIAITEVRP